LIPPTQTPNSGLTSTTQPQTPPTKVDVNPLFGVCVGGIN